MVGRILEQDASENWELSVTGLNLFDKRHAEFIENAGTAAPTQVERSVYGKVTWRY